ncbi:sugar ABC transporter ATP-binding protein [Testudinibacter sp. TR-2022]|uniref:sugar ABC transporter ATP-binding protein n=1 Tax=Testudinibacter sp. TR-2022 TaxID=2585029 RepID=UPI00111952F7|nr:sugar ABC transporter ATP-binding protein [Testudinibacter sp. TR-2022]TNG93731.1 sugar ABC transporter ATP-binding protein [Pasteurellaceae bacterium UScroc12]TNG95946.1 sugar ABC transporter ATP-binding protein [Pasteurellaceae bacterium USgator41]TNG97210.1 sugar ABC transporter ATP-binding protein [Pasteurellaceae bacterium UScroc31]TNH02994.1 sugar ABC transporter ATP-binding protein [Pasteurellaceae bacterium USgator11]TNH06865.1 sugar ABC transporter ATP-binding protein [Pasteurellac
MSAPLLKVQNLTKSFSGILALNGVQLQVAAGEVHALLGENGAGKSTLLKALSGAQPQTSGEIIFNGKTLDINDSPHARQLQGIVTIYQEFNLLPNMTVAENFFLGREPLTKGIFVDRKNLEQEAKMVLDNLKLNISPNAQVAQLSVAQQQMVEIARALTLNAKLIIMDEPSAALSDKEVETLHQIVRDLKSRGVSIIYVTHRLNEVFALCDRFTVFQDGKYTGEGNVAETNVDEIIRMMVGRNVIFNRRPSSETQHKDKPVVLSVRHLKKEKPQMDPHGIALHDVSFDIHQGEVLGIAGLVGAGRTEIARCLFGADHYQSGEITLNGKSYHANSPLEALDLGVALVPEDRKKEGLVLGLPIRTNMTLSNLKNLLTMKWFVNENRETDLIESYRQALSIKMASASLEARKLSGGNQQKIILARCMSLNPKVLIVDEPTRGIDVGAKSEVHQVLFDMAKKGVAVLVISSDLPEIMAISDRIITLSEGKVTGEIHGDDATEEKLMSMMAIGVNRH